VSASRGEGTARVPSAAIYDENEVARLRILYLDLLERALVHMLYRPLDITLDEHLDPNDRQGGDDVREEASRGLSQKGLDWLKVRSEGRDMPWCAQTMVGIERLANVRTCVERVLADGVPGDLIETGVWRGGVVILMRAILDAYGDRGRVVFAADSFQGAPPPNVDAYPLDAGSRLHDAKGLEVPREEVERNFDLYGLLDDRVQFVEGWFKDTLPALQHRTWSVVRLDGDLYESTTDALVNLYPGLSVGGFLIVDDYGHPPCRQAVLEYREKHGIDEPIQEIDWRGAFWRREH
jgi:macrocin-O-methyltransferase TylF-like protien